MLYEIARERHVGYSLGFWRLGYTPISPMLSLFIAMKLLFDKGMSRMCVYIMRMVLHFSG